MFSILNSELMARIISGVLTSWRPRYIDKVLTSLPSSDRWYTRCYNTSASQTFINNSSYPSLILPQCINSRSAHSITQSLSAPFIRSPIIIAIIHTQFLAVTINSLALKILPETRIYKKHAQVSCINNLMHVHVNFFCKNLSQQTTRLTINMIQMTS